MKEGITKNFRVGWSNKKTLTGVKSELKFDFETEKWDSGKSREDDRFKVTKRWEKQLTQREDKRIRKTKKRNWEKGLGSYENQWKTGIGYKIFVNSKQKYGKCFEPKYLKGQWISEKMFIKKFDWFLWKREQETSQNQWLTEWNKP